MLAAAAEELIRVVLVNKDQVELAAAEMLELVEVIMPGRMGQLILVAEVVGDRV